MSWKGKSIQASNTIKSYLGTITLATSNWNNNNNNLILAIQTIFILSSYTLLTVWGWYYILLNN